MKKDFIIRKNNELSTILEVSKVLTSSFDLERNLNSAMNILGSLLEMQRGCVFLLDPFSEELRLVAAHGLTKEEFKRGKYRIGEGIVGSVMKTGSPMFIPNIGEEPKFLNKTGSRPDKNGISFLCVPLELKGEILGVISADRIYSEEHGGVDDDLRVLKIVASLIAQFIKLWENYRKTDLECRNLKSQLKERYSLPNIIGESEKFQSVLKSVIKVASTDTSVLLLGESGTGKELIAKTLHYQSHRSKGPFVAVNCAAMPDNLLEAELFGVEKGAFTGATASRAGRFELAKEGTIFLDEIGELPFGLQAKLLRVLQEKSFERVGSSRTILVNVRVIAATNKNLQEEVKKGNFRDDLYWRLNVVPIVLPSLRERKGDIPCLLNFYLNKFNQSYQKKVQISGDVVSLFMEYRWPGNIREFANMVERLVIMAEKDIITPDDLSLNSLSLNPGTGSGKNFSIYEEHTLRQEVQSLERERIIRALKENKYIQSNTAKALGITSRQLGYRIKKYGIELKNLN